MLESQPDIRGCLLPLMARGLLDGMMVRQVVAAELQQLNYGVAAQAKSPEGASPETGKPVKPSVAGSAASPAKTLDVDAADPDTKMRSEHEAFEQRARALGALGGPGGPGALGALGAAPALSVAGFRSRAIFALASACTSSTFASG